jgi:hypothetical protein
VCEDDDDDDVADTDDASVGVDADADVDVDVAVGILAVIDRELGEIKSAFCEIEIANARYNSSTASRLMVGDSSHDASTGSKSFEQVGCNDPINPNSCAHTNSREAGVAMSM